MRKNTLNDRSELRKITKTVRKNGGFPAQIQITKPGYGKSLWVFRYGDFIWFGKARNVWDCRLQAWREWLGKKGINF